MQVKFLNSATIQPSSVFIIGTPSHGNLAQLTLDCTISTLAKKNAVRRVGIVDSPLLVPMTGYEKYCEEWGNTLCAPLEFDGSACSSPLYLLLQRSPCFEHATSDYAQDLLAMLSDFKPSSIILLAGCSNNAILDLPTPSRYIHMHGTNNESSGILTSLLNNSTQLPTEAVITASQDPNSPLSFLDMDTSLAILQTVTSIPSTLVACCCEEGINFNDGIAFGEKLLHAIGVNEAIAIPQSWQTLLQPPPISDFGMMY